MFRSCKLALGEDEHNDEREWQLRLAKSRKRQRKKKKDDALVASFFSHVEDPVAMCIAELLLDCSMDCRGDSTSFSSTNDCENIVVECQHVTVATTKNEAMQDQELNKHCDLKQNQCTIVEEDADDQIYFDAMDYSEPITSMHPMIVETESERTVKAGSAQSTSIEDEESNNSRTKEVDKSAIVESLTRNIKRVDSTGKENVRTKDGLEAGKKQTSLHHWSNIRRSPFHDSSKSIVLTSRQQKSLALNSF